MATTRILQLSDLHAFADPDGRLFGIPTRELLQVCSPTCRRRVCDRTTSS